MTKRLSASWFYWAFNRMSPVRIPANVGDFRLVDRRAVEVLRQLPERNRFMKGLFAWVGFNAIGVPYERPQRAAGSSKFNLWRLWNFALDGVVSFSTVPLRASFYGGLVIAAVAVLYALFIIGRVLIFGIDTPGYASLLIAVLLAGRHPARLDRHHRRISRPPVPRGEGPADLRRRGRLRRRRRRRPEGLMDLKEEDILGADIGRHWYYRSKAAALRRMVGRLAPQRLLDVGAGSGFFSRHLLTEGGAQSALCVDIGYAARPRRDASPASRCSIAATAARPTATSC